LASRCSREVRPKKCPTAAIWAGRLHPTPNKSPTVLEQRLLRSIDLEDRKSGLLQDPKTGCQPTARTTARVNRRNHVPRGGYRQPLP
jgi:hypothetical protein